MISILEQLGTPETELEWTLALVHAATALREYGNREVRAEQRVGEPISASDMASDALSVVRQLNST